MHRVILQTPNGLLTDHKNHDGLDNRRSNLRVCTNTENRRNERTRITGKTSRYKGVHFNADSRRWYARVQVNRKAVWWGSFTDEEVAARAYDEQARIHFGEFACTNFQ